MSRVAVRRECLTIAERNGIIERLRRQSSPADLEHARELELETELLDAGQYFDASGRPIPAKAEAYMAACAAGPKAARAHLLNLAHDVNPAK